MLKPSSLWPLSTRIRKLYTSKNNLFTEKMTTLEESRVHNGRKGGDTMNSLIKCQSVQELSERYNDLAVDYDQLSRSTGYTGQTRVASMVREMLPARTTRILDVGCGTGQVGEKLNLAGYHNLYGTDMSNACLKLAEQKDIYSKLIQADFGSAPPLSFSDGYFDAAVSAGCFLPMHLNETHLPEMIRLVRKGGYLIITTRALVFEKEEGDMKLKTGLRNLVDDGILEKILHEDFVYMKTEGTIGILLCYQVA